MQKSSLKPKHLKRMASVNSMRYMLHIACAMACQADVFVTTDDRLIKSMRKIQTQLTMLPGEAIAFVENWYEN